jgi:hypothetical protein
MSSVEIVSIDANLAQTETHAAGRLSRQLLQAEQVVHILTGFPAPRY